MRFKQVTVEAVRDHPRRFRDFRYIYPVVSRRSGGLSVGVNLNPGKTCNFDCVYCQVDRHEGLPAKMEVDLDALERELRDLAREITGSERRSGGCGEGPAGNPEDVAHFKDIAFSGDGEPTAFSRFRECVERVARVRDEMCPAAVRLVLITNASGLHRPDVIAAISRIDDVWAKLDAGTEAYYRLICRPSAPYRMVLNNIAATARIKPLVIQSMFVRWAGEAPPGEEIGAYARRLLWVRRQGGEINRVQIYTLARPPADRRVAPLDDTELEEIARSVRETSGEKVETFGSWR